MKVSLNLQTTSLEGNLKENYSVKRIVLGKDLDSLNYWKEREAQETSRDAVSWGDSSHLWIIN